MRKYRLSRPPQSLRRSTVRQDNIVLAPASLLPLCLERQVIANGLPLGEMLIILPCQVKQQRVAQSVATWLRKKGKDVRVVGDELQLGLSHLRPYRLSQINDLPT